MIVEIADVETDGFLSSMTKLWTIQIGRADSDEVTVYADQPGYPPLQEGIDRLKAADRVVFHNGMKFDIHAVNKIYPGTLEPEKVWDTMVGGRLLFPQYKTHSLDAWGERLKCAKGKYEGDFSEFTEELVTYARQDVVVTRKIWSLLMKKFSEWDWWQSFEMECLFQYVIGLQEQNGFMLDIPRAVELESDAIDRLCRPQVEHDVCVRAVPLFVGGVGRRPGVVSRAVKAQLIRDRIGRIVTGRPKQLEVCGDAVGERELVRARAVRARHVGVDIAEHSRDVRG